MSKLVLDMKDPETLAKLGLTQDEVTAMIVDMANIVGMLNEVGADEMVIGFYISGRHYEFRLGATNVE